MNDLISQKNAFSDENPGVLDMGQLQGFLKDLSCDDLVAAFYINRAGVSQDEWMDAFASCLNENGILTIGIAAADSDFKGFLKEAKINARISKNDIKYLDRINIFIIVDLDFQTDYPQDSKVLAAPHGLISGKENTPQAMCYQLHNLTSVDGWLPSFPISDYWKKSVKNFWTGFASPSLCRRKLHDLVFIPFGYPRLATLARELGACGHIQDSIIYAPMKNILAPEAGDNRLAAFGVPTIEKILMAAPEYNVIFRPYKEDLESQEVKNICAAFVNERRFMLDASPGRLASFSRGAALVTDLSHIGKSFAWSTLRPAIYFQPWLKNVANKLSQWKGGFYAHDPDSFAEAIKLALDNGPDLQKRISDGCRTEVIPPHNVFKELPQMLKDFHAGIVREEWLVIKRNEAADTKNEVELVKEIMALKPGAWPVASAAAHKWNNPQDPLLAAFALDCGICHCPKKLIFYGAAVTIGKLLGRDLGGYRYMDVPKAAILHLYAQALRERKRSGDMAGQLLVEYLLQNFISKIEAGKNMEKQQGSVCSNMP